MKAHLQELWRYRQLLHVFIIRDIRVRYKQSVLGFAWAILMPLLIVMVGIIVRYVFSRAAGTGLAMQDVVAIAIRAVPWAFIVGSIRFASNSLISNASLVTKIYFPKEVFPLSAVGSSLFDFGVACIPLALLVVVAGIGVSLQIFWLPVLLLILPLAVIGISLFLSAAGLFFRDVKYIVEVLLTFGIFFTPVFYDVSMLGDYGVYMMLNPFAPVLEGLEAVIVQQRPPDLFWLFYSAVAGGLLTIGGYAFFKRLEPAFAESI